MPCDGRPEFLHLMTSERQAALASSTAHCVKELKELAAHLRTHGSCEESLTELLLRHRTVALFASLPG